MGGASTRRKEAIDSYRTAVKLNPKLLAIRVWLNHKRRSICDWDGIEAEENELRALIAAAHGPDDGSELSAWLREAFDDCVDFRAMTDGSAVSWRPKSADR